MVPESDIPSKTNQDVIPSINRNSWFVKTIAQLIVLIILSMLFLLLIALLGLIIAPPELLDFEGTSISQPTLAVGISMLCVIFFVISLLLWVCDAIGVFIFTNKWMSKAIWGIGVSSIIGTTVAVYASSLEVNNMPFEGRWYFQGVLTNPKMSYSAIDKDNKLTPKTQEWKNFDNMKILVFYDRETEKYELASYGEGWSIYIANFDLDAKRTDVILYYIDAFDISKIPGTALLDSKIHMRVNSEIITGAFKKSEIDGEYLFTEDTLASNQHSRKLSAFRISRSPYN